ncbi:MAG: hypothetical protein EZS28_029193 [Streblomastix strix]|uniref:Uncharacterized protein n=1 Tax=Streblomastix strix TaxID=222440 RepID=A0A5J4UYK4_9EUKA|nr:MAG: hypothetical protein EZS28_029193 [Streblomastix strix]
MTQLGVTVVLLNILKNIQNFPAISQANDNQNWQQKPQILQGMAANHVGASYSSNFWAQFRDIYTQELLQDVRPRGFFTMNEVMLQIDIRYHITRLIRSKRSSNFAVQNQGSHIIICATVSPGQRSPPPFIIIDNLLSIPRELQNIADSEQAIFSVSKSGWINQDIFLQYIQMFSKWTYKQREHKYFEKDEPELMIIHGYISRKSDLIHELCMNEKTRVVTLTGALTSLLQPLDVAVFTPFRTYQSKQMGKQFDAVKMKSHIVFVRLTAEQKRRMVVHCAIDAIQQSKTSMIRENAFISTGFYPCNTNKPIFRDEIVKFDEDPKYANRRHPLNSAQSARVLVTPKKRKRDELQQDANIEEQGNPDSTQNEKGQKKRRLNDNSTQINKSNQSFDSEMNSKIKQISEQQCENNEFDKNIYRKNRANVPKAQRNDDLKTLIRKVQEEGARHQLRHRHLSAITIRQDACNYMLQHRQLYEDSFIADEETLEQYVAKMKNDGEYDDQRIFGAICDLYNIKIRIRMPGNIEFEDGKEGKPVIELGYVGHIHYVSIRRD